MSVNSKGQKNEDIIAEGNILDTACILHVPITHLICVAYPKASFNFYHCVYKLALCVHKILVSIAIKETKDQLTNHWSIVSLINK